CTAVGITMPIKTSAASTSASVKPPVSLALQRELEIREVGDNLIVHPVLADREPDTVVLALAKHHEIRTGLLDAPVRVETDLCQVNWQPSVALKNRTRASRNERLLDFDSQVLVHVVSQLFLILLQITAVRFQAVGPLLRIDPEDHWKTLRYRSVLPVARQP